MKALALIAAVALGALAFWLLFCRGESEELRRQIGEALSSDSASKAENVLLRLRVSELAALAAERDTARKRDSAAVDSIKRLPPVVLTVYVKNPTDTAGPLVPIQVVKKADFDELQARCDRLSGSCAATIAAKNAVIDSTQALADSADARADRLADRVARFTVPREPSRWGLGFAAPVTVSFQSEPGEPAVVQRYGVCGGATFTLLR